MPLCDYSCKQSQESMSKQPAFYSRVMRCGICVLLTHGSRCTKNAGECVRKIDKTQIDNYLYKLRIQSGYMYPIPT